jgi:transcriptional regulator with XRE-family HTH domain
MARQVRCAEERDFDVLVGRRIEKLRKAKGMTRARLSRDIGVTACRLYFIETGQRCSIYMLVKIAFAMDLPLRDLVPISQVISFPENACTEQRECV